MNEEFLCAIPELLCLFQPHRLGAETPSPGIRCPWPLSHGNRKSSNCFGSSSSSAHSVPRCGGERGKFLTLLLKCRGKTEMHWEGSLRTPGQHCRDAHRPVMVLMGLGSLLGFINIRGDSSGVSSCMPRQLTQASVCVGRSADQRSSAPDPLHAGMLDTQCRVLVVRYVVGSLTCEVSVCPRLLPGGCTGAFSIPCPQPLPSMPAPERRHQRRVNKTNV